MTLCHSHRKKDPFVRLNKSIVYDSNLSLKAKGLLSIAFSRPDDWSFYKHEMMKHCSDGEHSFDSGVKELENSGYLYRTRKQNKKNGRLEGWEWHFFEEPISEEEFKKFIRYGGFPGIGDSPISEEPGPNKNNYYTEKENNNKPTPSAVVVSSDEMIDLDNTELPDFAKAWLLKEHPDKVAKMPRFIRQWETRESDLKAMYAIIKNWDNWQDNPTPEECVDANYEFFKQTGFKDNQVIRNHRVSVGKRSDGAYIEFVCGQRVDLFLLSDKNFIKNLKKFASERLYMEFN